MKMIKKNLKSPWPLCCVRKLIGALGGRVIIMMIMMNLHPYKDPGPHGAHALLPNINIILHQIQSSGSEITWRWRVIELSSIGIHQQGSINQCGMWVVKSPNGETSRQSQWWDNKSESWSEKTNGEQNPLKNGLVMRILMAFTSPE